MYLAIDIETNGLNPRQNQIIGIGTFDGNIANYYTLAQITPELLESFKQHHLLTWNGSFDLRFILHQLKVDLVPSLYADVMLLKHTCDEEFPFGLKDVGAKIFGESAKDEQKDLLESIKANGGTGKQVWLADPEIIAKYCKQDCKLTYDLFTHYAKEAKSQGVYEFFHVEVMELYRTVTIPMEVQGIAVDMQAVADTSLELDEDISKLYTEITTEIAPIIAEYEQELLNKEYPLLTKTGKQPKWAKEGKTQRQAWGTEPIFNINSRAQIGHLFFNLLSEEPLSTTDKGAPQVNEEFLESISASYPWVPKLINFYKLQKLKGTYVDRYITECESGRFYASFSQHRTVSGRYAGDWQQLPRPLEAGSAHPAVVKHTSSIRSFFIPDTGCVLASADYEQLEPTIFAHTSGDTKLQKIFNTGADFYSTVAISTEGLKGVSADKKASNYLGKVNKAARQKAKAYALGIAYGMTAWKLQYEIGVPYDQAELLVEKYLLAFPDLANWMQKSQQQAKTLGYVKTQSGRIRHLDRAKQLWDWYGEALNSKGPEVPKEIKREFKNLINNAINFQVQGLAASIVNRAAINIERRLRKQRLSTRICGQIHDELLFNIPEHEEAIACTLIQHEMENVVKLSVPLRTMPQTGTNYKECK